jgi:hypothetical protein
MMRPSTGLPKDRRLAAASGRDSVLCFGTTQRCVLEPTTVLPRLKRRYRLPLSLGLSDSVYYLYLLATAPKPWWEFGFGYTTFR